MNDPTGSPRHISGGTGVALSLVVSLVVGAFSAGGTYVSIQADQRRTQAEQLRMQADVLALQAQFEAERKNQHTQALELTELRTEMRAIRESQARMEKALEQLTTEQRVRVARAAWR